MNETKKLELPCSKGEFMRYANNQVAQFKQGDLFFILGIEGGKWHLSISSPNRLPKYAEMKHARYKMLPDDCYIAQIFPPQNEFVNAHKNCLHLWEIDKP